MPSNQAAPSAIRCSRTSSGKSSSSTAPRYYTTRDQENEWRMYTISVASLVVYFTLIKRNPEYTQSASCSVVCPGLCATLMLKSFIGIVVRVTNATVHSYMHVLTRSAHRLHWKFAIIKWFQLCRSDLLIDLRVRIAAYTAAIQNRPNCRPNKQEFSLEGGGFDSQRNKTHVYRSPETIVVTHMADLTHQIHTHVTQYKLQPNRQVASASRL